MKSNQQRLRGLVGTIMMASCLLGAGISSGCQGRVSDRSIQTIQTRAAAERLRDDKSRVLVLDARDPDSYALGHIAGARLTRLSEIDLFDETPRFGGNDLIVVYGQNPGSGSAAALVKRLLRTKHKNVVLLEGGMDGWLNAGLPVEGR